LLGLDVTTAECREMLVAMFGCKRVPLALLGRLGDYRDFHRADFAAVQATMSPTVVLETFDSYFDFTLNLVERLQPFGDV